MWQSPNKGARTPGNGKRREKERLSSALHIRRVEGEIFPLTDKQEGNASPVRLILNDFSTKGIGIFSHSPMIRGQEIALVIAQPHALKVRGRVIWCQEHDLGSHILSDKPFGFRIGILFLPTDKTETDALQAFQDSLVRDGFLKAPTGVA